MQVTLNQFIAAVVVEDGGDASQRGRVSGGAPIFYVRDLAERQRLCLLLEKVLLATPHDLQNGISILVVH